MDHETQAVVLNGIPLLVLAAVYASASFALAPTFLRDRFRLRDIELTVALIYPCAAFTGAVVGTATIVRGEPLAGNVWLGAAVIAVASVPGLLFLARWRERGRLFDVSRTRVAEHRSETLEHQREAVNAFTRSLARATSESEIARMVTRCVTEILGVPFAAFGAVEESSIRGVYAEQDGKEADWWPDVRIDRRRETSAMVSAAFEAATLTIYDVDSSPVANRRIAERVGARSAAFVPCVAGEDVLAVLAAVTYEHHAFSRDELALLEELAAETALALERAASATALADALERERLVAGIARKVRSATDVDSALAIAVAETAAAIPGVSRAFIRLGELDRPLPVQAEWQVKPLAPVGKAAAVPVPALAATGRTEAIGDVEAATELDSDTRETLLALGAHAVLTTPILILDRVAGFFELHRPERTIWSSSEIALAETVASEVGHAIHTVTLVDENRVRLQRQSALLNAARALAIDLRFEAVIERLVQEVVTLVAADGADCWLLDRHRRTLSRRAAHGSPAKGGDEMRLEDALAEAVAGNRPLLNRGVAAAPFAEAMVAPIAFLGEGRGILRVWTSEEGRFDEDDLDLLEAFATLASLAARNAEAFEEGTRQARVQRGFYRIASVLAEPLSLESTLHALAQAASEALGGTFAAVLMPSTAGELELSGAAGLPPPLAESLTDGLSEAEAPLRAAASEARVLAAPDVATDERFGEQWRELAAGIGYRSLLAIPVPAPLEPEASGLVLVFFVEARSFTDDDLELAHHVAGAARGALERGATFEEERTARSLAQQLARTGSRLATELDPASVLDEVVEQAPELVGVEACAIRLVDGDDLVVTAVAGAHTSRVLGTRAPASGWVSGDVMQGGTPLAVSDAAGDDRLLSADPLLRLGYRGYLGVPLTSGEGALQGVLAVYSRDPKAWRDAEIEALLALAGNVSAALSNAELYQRVAIEKERSDAILANVADGIVAVDREGLVVLWNAAAERITGVPIADAVGRAPFELLGRDLRGEGDSEIRNRHVPILRGGDEVWLSVSEAVMRDPAGAVAGRIYAFRDVSTERVVEEMKSEFVSTVSEQLRRPLTSIYGFAETLLREDVRFAEPERRTFLRYIASESERLTEIVDQLLNVARLDTGDLQVHLAPTDVRGVVEEVVSAMDSTARDGHRFVVDVPASPVTAAADPEKLRLVLANLLDNAVKFSPRGGQVTIVARRHDGAVEISVSDEGVGIPPAAQELIFKKFYRGEGTPSRGSAGTGLGLFIAEGLVTAMHGRIWVTSAEGRGSSFTFELPEAESTEAPVTNHPDAERV